MSDSCTGDGVNEAGFSGSWRHHGIRSNSCLPVRLPQLLLQILHPAPVVVVGGNVHLGGGGVLLHASLTWSGHVGHLGV